MGEMPFSVRFFGTSAATPSLRRGFACIGLVKKNKTDSEDIILMDCGDGSIRRILEQRTNPLSISNILITHFHSDHLSGLAQVIETMSIKGRKNDLNIYAQRGLKEYFSTVQKTTNVASKRQFDVNFFEINNQQSISVEECKVTPLSMQHTVPCLGYRIEHPDFLVAYTGDTEPGENILSLAREASLLIHEATFLARDRKSARETKHSIPSEAADVASKAKVQNLILTHVNDDREAENEMLKEAREIYSKTKIAHDGLEFDL
jgi:ribonuclease Z